MLKVALLAFSALVAASLLSCPSNSVSQSPVIQGNTSVALLEGREWRISPPAEDQSQTWPHRSLERRPQPYIVLAGETIKGATGCGMLTGTFHGSGNRISIATQWVDASAKACGAADRNDGSQIVASLNRVIKIDAPPEYWHDDAVLLKDAQGVTRIVLSPMKTGSDLSDVVETFWHLSSLGSRSVPSDILVWFEEGQITFSSPSCLFSYPFRYDLAGLRFFPAWRSGTNDSNSRLASDKGLAGDFEASMHRIASYRIEEDRLPLRAANRLRSAGGDLQFQTKSLLCILAVIPRSGADLVRWTSCLDARDAQNGLHISDPAASRAQGKRRAKPDPDTRRTAIHAEMTTRHPGATDRRRN